MANISPQTSDSSESKRLFVANTILDYTYYYNQLKSLNVFIYLGVSNNGITWEGPVLQVLDPDISQVVPLTPGDPN